MAKENIATPIKPKIYAYTTPEFKSKGFLKVGYTTRDVEVRISEQFPTKSPHKNPYEILLDEIAVDDKDAFFDDHEVHRRLEQKGFERVNGEWFKCSVKDIKSVINEIKSNTTVQSTRASSFPMRPEQVEAVRVTSEYFDRYSKSKEKKAPHFLWNAKMRFGKTFASYQLALHMGWRKILVLTYKPAVQNAWREDLASHVDFEGWQFIGSGESFDGIDESKPFVWFASFQDILGKTKDGKIKERLEAAHLTDWDCCILDEYHFGSWRDSARDLYDGDPSEQKEFKNEDKLLDEELNEDVFPLSVNAFLYLSGTPFRAVSSGEFLEDQIFNWTYSDEQREKTLWNEKLQGENPYASLPQMTLMTYQMPEDIREVALKGENNEFDLSEFFKAEDETFKYEVEVQKWLNLIRGQHMSANPIAGGDAVKPPIPFEDTRLLNTLLHTFWFLPSVASCFAMQKLLKAKVNTFYHDYHVIVAAGVGAGIGEKALPPVKKAMQNPLKTKTITLSCGKLTTGVSVPPWSGIFMLRNTSSPETYFQAAFRVQTPWSVKNIDKKSPNKSEILKTICYVFDFAPNRALQLISEYSARLDLKDTGSPERRVEEFIKFLPVLCYDGYSMTELNAGELLDIVASGTASTMLAKRWQSAQLVNVDNATLEKLLNNDIAMDALENIEAFRGLSKDIKKVISSEKALNKAKKEKSELTQKEEKEKKENQGFKKILREKLIKFATRVPIFMYLTDNREETLQDVITELEPELFTKVTGLKVKDFELLAEIGVFNSQVMNSAIFAFKRFEEGSLTYAGGNKLSEYVGGYDAVVSRTELAEINDGIM